MRKLMTVLIASSFLGVLPVMAAETHVSRQDLGEAGFSAEEINNADEAISEQPTTNEMEMQRRFGRYCPRGYVLRAYRVRIGPIVVVRYRCERRYYHGWYGQEPSQQQETQE